MTNTSATYTKALERAHAEHLSITDLSFGAYGDEIQAHVYNPKYSEGYYTVRQARGATVLTCNCQAGQNGVFCKHRALVRETLEQRAAAQAATVVVESCPRVALTDRNWREEYARQLLSQ